MLALLATAPLLGQDKKPHAPEAVKNPVFDQFKRLAGDWVGTKPGKDGQPMHVRYQVTSGGSAVVETISPGGAHEMVTVIHPDGADLLLTHYCMLGNQPHMRATANGASNKVEFKFIKATNMKSPKDMHMHDATYTFVDNDTLRSEWTHYVDGKNAGAMAFELKRKK
jgi:hypothetical protein